MIRTVFSLTKIFYRILHKNILYKILKDFGTHLFYRIFNDILNITFYILFYRMGRKIIIGATSFPGNAVVIGGAIE